MLPDDVALSLQVTGLRTRTDFLTIEVKFMKLDHLSTWQPQPHSFESPLLSILSNHVSQDETVLDVIFLDLPAFKTHAYNQWIRAGPRKSLYFEPRQVVAAVVTCGGLCPGLNSPYIYKHVLRMCPGLNSPLPLRT